MSALRKAGAVDMSDPVDHAHAASEAIRQLNHATLTGSGTVADLYGILGALSELAGRLPQTFTQTARLLERRLDAGQLNVGEGPHASGADQAVAAVAAQLETAAGEIETIYKRLTKAHQIVSGIADHA